MPRDSKTPSEPEVAAWERRAEWPLGSAAIIFLAAYSWPILDQGIPSAWNVACHRIDDAVWLMFVIDYAIRLKLARRRARYVGRHLPDLAVVALPILRPLRLLRLVMLLRLLNRSAADSLRGRVALYVAGAAILLVYTAALAELDAERHAPHANITDFGDALWWATTTVTTVGYGDRYPTTTEGRFVAAGLMIGGIALIGIITATLASWLIARVQELEEGAQAATRRDLVELQAEVRELTAAVHSLATGLRTGPESGGESA